MARGESEPPLRDSGTADFLQKKGSIEMVVEIGEQGTQRHTDLREELLLSSSTIQQRLKDGKEHNIWEQTLEERGDVAAKVYQLTSLGESIYENAVAVELDQLYQSRRDIIRSVNNRERRVIVDSSPPDADWLADIDMEEREIASVQLFLQQFGENNRNEL
jgi:DNA-binding PadR family transcriptional regulator